MHKDELLQLHSLLCQVKRFFEAAELPTEAEFGEYEDLQVSPQHIHKSKTDHKRAVFLLGKGLSEVVMAGDDDHRARLKDRFLRLANGKKGVSPEAQAAAEDTLRETAIPDSHLPAFALAALRG